MHTSREEVNRILQKVGNTPGKFLDVNLTKNADGSLIKQLIKEGFLYSRSDQVLGMIIEFI